MEGGVEVDFVMLADRAEIVNGKLYAMGAAWDQIGVHDFNQPVALSVAMGLLVPWSATNQEHRALLTMRDADGQPLDFRVEVKFVTGRPPFLNGETQRVLFALPTATIRFPGPGAYVLSLAVDDVETKTVRLRAAPPGPPNPTPAP